MKALKLTVIFALLFIVASTAYAQDFPKPTGFVNDYANILPQDQGKTLNSELAAFEEKTSVEIAVVTVPSLNGQKIEDYTKALGNAWGVGKPNKNNGVVFLIAPNERKVRIETAAGIRNVLTDSRANDILNSKVLPQFKAGKMAQGIIDGTHAIMRTINPKAAPMLPEETAQPSRAWTAEDTKMVSIMFISMASFITMYFVIRIPINRAKARRYVLKNKDGVAARFAEAAKTSLNADVSVQSRLDLRTSRENFTELDRLATSGEKVNWSKLREQLEAINYQLGNIVYEMWHQISFAEKARNEGPGLFEQIPSLIDAAGRKISEGEQSKKATQYLADARIKYAEVQSQYEGADTDWVAIYVILTAIQSSIESAESAHHYANSYHSDSWSSHSDSSSSYGFDGTGGFSGGGFDGGGGATGGW